MNLNLSLSFPKRALFSACATGALFLLAAEPQALADDAAKPTVMSKEQLAVAAQVNKIPEAYAKRDVALATSPYSKTHFVCFDAVPPLFDEGYDRIVQKVTAYFDATTGPTNLEFSHVTIVADKHLAYWRGIVHWRATLKTGKSFDVQYRSTIVLEKEGGQWMIVHEHDSQPAKMGLDNL